MSRINPKLMLRLEEKLGVGRRRLNELILSLANSQRIERDTAALTLAADNGIPIHRFSTPEQRAGMRPGSQPFEISSTPASPGPLRPKLGPQKPKSRIKPTDKNSVFVVHGRDASLRKALFDFLYSVGLKPLEWEKAILQPKDINPHVDDVLDVAMGRVQAVVVLFSPDDDAMLNSRLHGKNELASERKLQGQPRPNVLFEAGMALARHPDKTLILQVGTVRGFSDIAGRHVIRLTNAKEKRNDVINRLEKIGCQVDRRGTDWMTTGDFTAQRDKKVKSSS
jgi:predicted nucleotide-binding protein